MVATKRRRVSGNESETITRLPEELVLEILTWVPARELGRCKAVCKLWKSLIGSPPFLPLYRRRNRCLIAYWAEGGRLRFCYSPIRRHRTDPDEKFRWLGSLPMGRHIDPITQPVNGVICQGKVTGDGNVQLTVYSLCTGQGIRVPPPRSPPCYGGDTQSWFSLGYDPISKRYKLLRFIFRVDPEDGRLRSGFRVKAEVITLGPTGTVWKWRKLDDDAAGIRRLPVKTIALFYATKGDEASMFSGDGALCWLSNKMGMVLFDVHREKFRWVKLPPEVLPKKVDDRRPVVPRVRFSDDRLAVHLWLLPASGDKFKPEIDCFILEDDDGKVWKKSSEDLRVELCEGAGWFGIVNGSVRPDASIMLMNSASSWMSGRRRQLYCTKGMKRFWVGHPPNWNCTNFRNEVTVGDGWGRFSCLLDSNVLYLSLRDVLDGNGLV